MVGASGQSFSRLPLWRVEGFPEVRARLRGDASIELEPAASSDGDSLSVNGSFPWSKPLAGAQDSQFSSAEGADTPDKLPHELPGETPPNAPAYSWWEGIPAVRQLLLEGLDLGAATVFIGENGSGKSTLVEALAMSFGLSSEGGSTGSRHHSWEGEAGLDRQLSLLRNALGERGGYFLRAETMHAFYTYLENNPRLASQPDDHNFHAMSHGESFVTLVEDRFSHRRGGLYVLDEPESALSFENQLRLMRHLQALMATGRHQIVMATHSPILAALPGATLLEVGEHGFAEVDHDDATLVRQWRAFMNRPGEFPA